MADRAPSSASRRLDLRAKPPEPPNKPRPQTDARYASVDRKRSARDIMAGDIHAKSPSGIPTDSSKASAMAPSESAPEGSTVPSKATAPWGASSPQYFDNDTDDFKAQNSTSSQKQLNEYREKLARDLGRRELSARGLLLNSSGKRVSPIEEENPQVSLPPALNTTATNASTESGNTIRGGMTPANVANTPSYPFPRMAAGAHGAKALAWASGSGSRPSHMASFEPPGAAQDRVLSNNSTPASTFTFNPPGASPDPENLGFPNPNLYDLSLMLSAEPGLDAWWNTVVEIMKEVYSAERVTLSVPADTTDIENVPWGQKATYNRHLGDGLSLGYLGKSGSALPTSDEPTPLSQTQADRDETTKLPTPQRPNLMTRHSWTGHDASQEHSQSQTGSSSTRPSYLARSRSYWPSVHSPEAFEKRLSHMALEEHDMLEENVPLWQAPYQEREETKGRVLPILQALDYEADPLIDHAGVLRVLERGKAVTLTRTYPYLENSPAAETQNSTTKPTDDLHRKPSKPSRASSTSKRSSLFGSGSGTTSHASSAGAGKPGSAEKGRNLNISMDEDEPRPPTPKYEEYEQAPPSPWSQSPAPSPAVRTDTKENPFFMDATVDEDSFNPGSAPADYTGLPPPEAIGVDNSWTVLHIPLTHVLQSRPFRRFKLDSSAMDQKSRGHGQQDPNDTFGGRSSPDSLSKGKAPAPIAILSILSPVIPYPSNLRHSLEHLAPHMATSFSLCRHYENLETELAGLQRRRPSATGFGAVATDGRPLTQPFTTADIGRQQSHCGSMTSPSEYSGVSKSMTGSPAGTPGWDQASLSSIANKRQPAASPAAQSHEAEGYFSSKQRPSVSRHETFGGSSSMRLGKEILPEDKRHSRLSASKAASDVQSTGETADKAAVETDEGASESIGARSSKSTQGSGSVVAEEPFEDSKDRLSESSRQGQRHHGHTMLHSYGADFSSTFQSLPPSSSLHSRPTPLTTPSRGMSYMAPMDQGEDLRPPTVRLKGLVLDALPAHIFVALPQTGEIVWVNSRYLSYRGQTVADLTEDPWSSIHPDDCDDYLKGWAHSLRTGEQFSTTVRIKRFDGQYRWFYARAVASKDKRGVIQQFLGSYMDIHDQHIAELKAARQEEIEASEAKHRLLANLIPQIIFTATEEDGVTFANEQWLSYTGQSFEDSLGLGFLDFVHPEDLARCRIPTDQPPTPLAPRQATFKKSQQDSSANSETSASTVHSPRATDSNLRGVHQALSRHNSSGNSSIYELPSADLSELAKKGIIKVGKDSNGRPSYTTEVRLRSKKGEYRWHLIRCVEIDTIDFGSGASSYFGSATDINDHKILETKLKEAMESKSRFLSNMSHEIRTPLIGISGMVSFLQDTVLNEEQRDYTNTIQTSANSLIMIINDILDLSKVDAGMMKLKFEWFHTRSLIEDVNELVSTMAIAKGLELNYLVEADVPAYVKGDKVRIRQVLLNIIGNAIKFTATGEVFSHCKVVSRDVSGDGEHEIMLEYSIIDTGQGFNKQEAEMIFKPFSQIDGSSTRQHGGSGLGLVISKQLVELHGGKIAGSSEPGKGSTFTFTARFSLPTPDDHPDLPGSPATTMYSATSRQPSTEDIPGNFQPLPAPKQLREVEEATAVSMDHESGSPVVTSNGSSNPSVQSARSHATDKSSVTSVNTGLARFSEAAKASGQDLSQMKLEMPSGRSSPGRAATPSQSTHGPGDLRPPMYSILILCPQKYSREATAQHIEMTIPSDVPHQTTAVESVEEAQKYISGPDPIKFTHIVINLGSAEAVLELMDQISLSQKIDKTTILVLSDSVQRQAVLKLAANTAHDQVFSNNQVTFIYKPVKPSRFAVIFDPNKIRDLSIDRNRSTAQRMVETQKASYLEIEKRMGNKGYKVLLVEDNPVNQKVLMKYLKKIGVEVDVAADGAECTDKVLSKSHTHYSLILVSSPFSRTHIGPH